MKTRASCPGRRIEPAATGRSAFRAQRRWTILAVLVLGRLLRADEREWFVPLGPPPEAGKRRISGGEGVPPLPLPATPLRRSERKREPSPPKLAAKVVWGESATFTYSSGGTTQIADWNLCPGDLQQLLKQAGERLGVAYGADSYSLANFDGDPVRVPLLLFSGVRTIKFAPAELDLLRNYVLRGGTIVADSVAGAPYFYASFRAAMEAAFPDLRFHTVPADHPVYHLVADADRAKFPKNLESDRSFLEGLYVYARLGVVLSKYGLGCGWDGHEVPLLDRAVYYDVDSANRIGLNLVAYVLAHARLGRAEAQPETYGALDEKRPTDEFVFAQIRHEGGWNVHAGGVPRLLDAVRQQTALRVSLKRVPVQPGREGIPSTFLYLTGLDEFQWDAPAVAALRRFLEAGGTLLINNGLGLQTFDRAVRRELKKVVGNADLTPIPATHPLFNVVHRLAEAHYSPALKASLPELKQPWLEGVTLHGELRVLYSLYDLEAGWAGLDYPLARAYAPETALPLGVNIVAYAMTH